MQRNLFLNLGDLADSTTKAIIAQRGSLDSLAKVILYNHIVFDYLLAQQSGVCAIASTFCTWINSPEK